MHSFAIHQVLSLGLLAVDRLLAGAAWAMAAAESFAFWFCVRWSPFAFVIDMELSLFHVLAR